MSMIDRLRAFQGIFGTIYGGSRDLYAVFGYRPYIGFEEMFQKYVRQDIAGRIVEAEPHATWSAPPVLETTNQAYKDGWNDLIQRHNLYGKFSRLDKLAGLGRYSVLVIGFDDGKPLDQPLDTDRQNRVIYLQPYGEATADILQYERDQTNPRFGQPVMYRISPQRMDSERRRAGSTTTSNFAQLSFSVHYSRVLHVAENTLEDDLFGIPRLQRVYNLLDDLQKTAGGSAETFWLTSNRGMQVDIDKDMDLKADDAAALSDEIDEYFHNLRRVIRTKGVKIENLGSDVADPRGTFSVLIALISGATGIPQRILLGSEAGQLASEQDRANWAVRIEERRQLFAEPVIINPFSRKMIECNVLPAPTDLTHLWPDAFRQNPLERAQTSAQQARSLANVSKALSDAVPVVTPEEGRAIIGLKGEMPTFDDPQDANPVEDDSTAPGTPGNPGDSNSMPESDEPIATDGED